MKTEHQKRMDEEPFGDSSPEIVEMTVRNKGLSHQLRETDYADNEAEQRIYWQMFGSIGKDVYIDTDSRCEYGKNIYFGNKVIVNMNCTLLDNDNTIIGNNVMTASDVKIYTATRSVHLTERMSERACPGAFICDTIVRSVLMEDGVRIGGGSTILPGVTIGKSSIIGAGSAVVKHTSADSIAVGNPCRVIKNIEDND